MLSVELRERVDHPVWIGYSNDVRRPNAHQYYRGILPARMTGGESRATINVAGRAYSLCDPQTAFALAAMTGPVEVRGLGPVNVFRFPNLQLAPAVTTFITAINAAGGNVWIEMDDDVFAFPYVDMAMQELVCILGPTWAALAQQYAPARQFIEDRYARNARINREGAERLLAGATGAIVSTEPLAAVVRPYNANVYVLPNVVDPADWPPLQRPGDGVVRVGFAGNRLKYQQDLPAILPELLDVAQLPNVELHFFGWQPRAYDGRSTTEGGVYWLDGVRYHYHPDTHDLFAYYRAIGILDVAVAPLEPTPLNRSRSAGKWLEHSMCETPLVVADLEPYNCVEHGVTGLKARTSREWIDGLHRLVEDVELRRRIGAAARAEVLRNHSIAAWAPRWRGFLSRADEHQVASAA